MSKNINKTTRRHSWFLTVLVGFACLLLIGNAGGSAGSGFFSLNNLFGTTSFLFPGLLQAAAWTFTLALFYGFGVVYGRAQINALKGMGLFVHEWLDAYYEEKEIKLGYFKSLKVLFNWTSLKKIWAHANEKYSAYEKTLQHQQELETLGIDAQNQKKYLDAREQDAVNVNYQTAMKMVFERSKNHPYIVKHAIKVTTQMREASAAREAHERSIYPTLFETIKTLAHNKENPDHPFKRFVTVRLIARDLARQKVYEYLKNPKINLATLPKNYRDFRPFGSAINIAMHNTVQLYFNHNPDYRSLALAQFQEAFAAEVELLKAEIKCEQQARAEDLKYSNKTDQDKSKDKKLLKAEIKCEQQARVEDSKYSKKTDQDKSKDKKLPDELIAERVAVRTIELEAELAAYNQVKHLVPKMNKRYRLQQILRSERQQWDDAHHVNWGQTLLGWFSYPIAFLAACANGSRSYFGLVAIAIALHAPPLILAGMVVFGILSGFNSSISLTAPATVKAFEAIGRNFDRGALTLKRFFSALPKLLLTTIACLGSAAFIFKATTLVAMDLAKLGIVLSNPVTLWLAGGAALFTFFAAFSLYSPHVNTKPFKMLAKYGRCVLFNSTHPGERTYLGLEKFSRTGGLVLGVLATAAMGLIVNVGLTSLVPMIASHVALVASCPPALMTALIITIAVISALVMGALVGPHMYKQIGRLGRPEYKVDLDSIPSEEANVASLLEVDANNAQAKAESRAEDPKEIEHLRANYNSIYKSAHEVTAKQLSHINFWSDTELTREDLSSPTYSPIAS